MTASNLYTWQLKESIILIAKTSQSSSIIKYHIGNQNCISVNAIKALLSVLQFK